jgi:hypothetical protein
VIPYRELNYLRVHGFITRDRIDNKSVYSTTNKSLKHALNPFVDAQNKQKHIDEIVSKKVESILMDKEEFRNAVYEMAQKLQSGNEIIIPGPQQASPPSHVEIPSPGATAAPFQDPAEIEQPFQPFKSIVYKDKNGKQVTFEEKFKEVPKRTEHTAQVKNRKKFAKYYIKKMIDKGFFKSGGGNLMPVYLKTGDVEIISESNREFIRGHVTRKLLPHEIMNAGFHIQKITEDGINVFGKGMKEPKFLKF